MNYPRTKTITLAVVGFCGAIAILHLALANRAPRSNATTVVRAEPAPASSAQVREGYGRLPLAFEPDRGPAQETGNFRARGAGYTLSLSATAASFLLAPGTEEPSPTLLRMNLVGAKAGATVEALEELEGKVNYLIGNDPAEWRTNVPTFARVRYREVYPGIDVVYYGNQRRLEYDFLVGAGRDAREIALEFPGVERVGVDSATGDLLLGVGEKTIRQLKPVVYQETAAGRREVEGRYALQSGGRVGFEVGDYDRSATLVIDPVLVYSTYLGGNGQDAGFDIAVDSSGNAYVTGFTRSTNFPTVNAPQGTLAPGGGQDAFVTKINAAGSAIVYSTYLGGNNVEIGNGIAVDSAGNVFLVGVTASTDFPTFNALRNTNSGGWDAFVAKLNPTGSAFIYSTYLGGSGDDVGNGIALDASGSPIVTGSTFSSNFPTALAFQSMSRGEQDAFVTKINNAGTALTYSTYLGGNGTDIGYGIAVDAAGAAYVSGQTTSTNFPTANAFRSTPPGPPDLFITKLNPAGTALVYSTYHGGAEVENTFRNGLAVDAAGSVHLVGVTDSSNFPLVNAFQGGVPGEDDAFVSKFNPAGSALIYSTFLGRNNFDAATAVAVDSAGNAHVTGFTGSHDFPIANAFQSTFSGFVDAFVAKFNPAGALFYSSFLGGSGRDDGLGIAVDSAGDTYLTGVTNFFPGLGNLRCFPITTGAFDTIYGGADDAFVTKIGETGSAAKLLPCFSKLLNIGTRARVLGGDSALIGGFIITGNVPKEVIIRGIGPSLTGVPGALANPTLELFDSNQVLLDSNDDWITNRAEVEATTIPPSHDLESAIVTTLAPGAYTAILRGKDKGTGIGVVEVYDLNNAVSSELANLSSRGFVDIGDNVMIGGIIVGGEGRADSRVAVRGLGPSLGALGVTDPLQDPIVEVKNANGVTLLSNDNWEFGTPAEISQYGLAPGDSRESAIVTSLPHGNYTVILRGKDNGTGVGVVEVFNVRCGSGSGSPPCQ